MPDLYAKPSYAISYKYELINLLINLTPYDLFYIDQNIKHRVLRRGPLNTKYCSLVHTAKI